MLSVRLPHVMRMTTRNAALCQHMRQQSMSCTTSRKAHTAQHAAGYPPTPFESAPASPTARPPCPLASPLKTMS
jgi:hypothetical protein